MNTLRNLLLSGLIGGLFAGPGLAQDRPPPPGLPEEQKTEPVEDPRPGRAEELAGLIAELAKPDAKSPEETEARIIELWSFSGSDIADLLLRRGRDAMNAEDYPTAIGHLTACLELSPDFAEAWNARATAFYLRGDFGPSLADIDHTLALNPGHFGALAGLGMILEQLGQETQALAAFRAAQALNPHREMVNDAVKRLEPKVDGPAL